ncbi:MAG TPA: PEGA domain-containing protein [Myxococcales bacterium]|nr:PEGA domain-containing protein [Myxococcales bacterium]
MTSTPGGAQIYIDGGDSTRVTPVTPANPIRLPPGNHQVELRLNGKVVSTHTVAIKPGETTTLRRDLAP